MTRLMRWTVLFLLMSGGAAYAQNLVGTWQGTLNAGKELRLVFRIASGGTGLTATMYSIDQGGQPLGASTITAQGGMLKIALPRRSVRATRASSFSALTAYISSPANSRRAAGPLRWDLTRANADTAWEIPAPPAAMLPMAAGAKPVFEVATIKASIPDRPGKVFTVRGRQVMTVNTTGSDLLTMAYGLHPGQILGAPSWFASEKFDVTGQPDASGVPNQEAAGGG